LLESGNNGFFVRHRVSPEQALSSDFSARRLMNVSSLLPDGRIPWILSQDEM
jgi:hypothetical protein